MSVLALSRVFGSRLQGAEASFENGLHVVLGAPADGSAEIAELSAGVVRPKRGTCRIDGRDPWDNPSVRARIGVLLEEEPASSAKSIARAVSTCLSLRQDPREANALLAEHGLACWASVRPERAPASIRRHVALALALSLERPLALVLHEPLAVGPLADRDKTRSALVALAEAGSAVLVLTASPRDAAELGGRTVLLDRGRFVRRPGLPLGVELVPGGALALAIRTGEARRLAAALVDHGAVDSASWDADQILVRGKDPSALALAVTDCAVAAGIELGAIEPTLPDLNEARAATAGVWRAAYEAALEAGRAHARARMDAGPRPRTLADLPKPAAKTAADVPPPPPSEGTSS